MAGEGDEALTLGKSDKGPPKAPGEAMTDPFGIEKERQDLLSSLYLSGDTIEEDNYLFRKCSSRKERQIVS